MSADERQVMVELKDVSLSYSSRKSSFQDGVHSILEALSLKIYEKETLGIVGKNGSGKSTLLRLIASILRPTNGEVITQQGKTVSLLAIGLGFNPQLSGRDNAFLSAMLQGSDKHTAESYLEGIKEFSELGDSFEEPVKTYSSGMKARLGFTTALKSKIDVLLIDEILSVGDAHFRQKAYSAMKERIAGDQTVVLVSHSDEQIMNLCDRAIWLNNGQIQAAGEATKVIQDYRKFINNHSASANHRTSANQR